MKHVPAYSHSYRTEGRPIIPAAFDVETDGLGGELLYCTLSTAEIERAYSGSPDDIIDAALSDMFSKPSGRVEYQKNVMTCRLGDNATVYYAHNMQYDARYFIFRANDLGYRLEFGMRTDTDFYEIKIIDLKNYTFVCLRDSAAIFPNSLEEFAKQFAAPDLKKLSGPNFDAGEIFDPENPDHRAYAMRDSQALRSALGNYFDAIRHLYGVHCGATAAGTALRAWQKTLPFDLKIRNLSAPVEEFMREGYYGGLVFLTSNAMHNNCTTFDINSSYPAAMREFGAPSGKPAFTTRYFPYSDRPGMYRVIIKSPDDLIVPIIPVRVKGMVRWPRGTFETVVTNLEIDFAVQNGYEVLRVIEGYVYEKVEYIFSDFVNLSEKIRTENKKKPFETVAKQMQNSVYGKYATGRIRRSVIRFDPSYPNAAVLPMLDPSTSQPAYMVTRTMTPRDESVTRPDFSAFITASARIRLLRSVYAVGPENCLYGDTDSITIKDGADLSRIDSGPRYGQFKLEKFWHCFRPVAPKVYAGERDDGEGVSTMSGAAKGLSKKKMTVKKFHEILQTGECSLQYDTLASLLRVMQDGGLSRAHPVSRFIAGIKNSANYEQVNNSSNIRPKKFEGN